MKCEKCGFVYEGIFCPECGTKNVRESIVTDSVELKPIYNNQETSNKEEDLKKEKSKKDVPWYLSIPFIVTVYVVSMCCLWGIPGIVLSIVRLIRCKEKITSSIVTLSCLILPIVLMILLIGYIVSDTNEIEELIDAGQYSEARVLLDEKIARDNSYTYIQLYCESYEAEGKYDEAANVIIEYCNSCDSPLDIYSSALNKLEELKDKVSEDIYNDIIAIEQSVEIAKAKEIEQNEVKEETKEVTKEEVTINEESVTEVVITDVASETAEIDSDIAKYEFILNSYEVSIEVFSDDCDLEKYRYETDVYIDGEIVPVVFGSSIYINTVLEEGNHKIWLIKSTNNKEKESNKIEFEVSPAYTNQLKISANMKNKKEYSLMTSIENNQPFEGYETEFYDGLEIIRDSSGKQIYYTVQFLINNTEFIGNTSVENVSIIELEKVARGDTAIAPSAPYIEDYKFIGWSEDISCIKSDMDVYAKYELVEEECYSEYLGEYQLKTKTLEGEEYICILKINRITNVGVYFSLNFIDYDLGEVIVDNELATWHTEGYTAQWSYDGSKDGLNEYYFVLALFEDYETIATSITDRYKNTNADSRYEKVK